MRSFPEAAIGRRFRVVIGGSQPADNDRFQVTLYAVAALLLFVGVALLVASVMSFRDDGGSSTAAPQPPGGAGAAAETTATPTPRATTASTAVPQRTQVASATTPAETPTETPAPDDTPTATAEPNVDVEPQQPADPPTETPTEPPPPPTPTPEPTEPAGRFIAITGPGSAAVGEAVSFGAVFSASHPPDKLTWNYDGQSTSYVVSVSTSFPSDGCFVVILDALYLSDGETLQASHAVAVGDGTC